MPLSTEGGGAAHRAFVGLGANLGRRVATLRSAIDAIDALPETRVVARSSLWRSAPVDAPGDDYVNAVVEIETCADAPTLLARLQAIEAAHGRARPYPNAPRTLDLDLLLFDAATIETPALAVPHPRLALRAFVLAPLAEIAPDVVVPGRGPVRALLDAVGPQRVARLSRADADALDRLTR